MQKKTRKNRKPKKRGGDIDNRNGLKYILSIGYEIETGYFTKLTKTEATNDENEIVLYNSDSARKDIEVFKQINEKENLDDLEDEFLVRMEETLEEDALNDNNEVDPNIIFNITNDVAKTRLYRYLKILCDNSVPKNDLYLFRSLDGQEYKINFFFRDEDRTCDVFSTTEWLFTYLKPTHSNTIVIDTFANALTNLVRHLSDLEEIEGNFIINTNEGELIIDNPKIRTLYHKPNTNIYYLDTHIMDKKFTIDDMCCVSQMTFSCHIENVILVMKTLVKDNFNTIQSISQNSEDKFNVLNKIENTLNKLIESYNQREPTFKIIMTKQNAKIIRKIYGYLYLILYKLFMYYNNYLQVEKKQRTYFKNTLFFACRHDNNILYDEVKKNMKLLFMEQLNQMYNGDEREINNAISALIQRLVVQEDILTQTFTKEYTKIRKNAFSPKNILEKNTTRYGNPEFSLLSYFHFFENPTDNSFNVTIDGELVTNEWFIMADIDTLSAKMELKNDIVLLEFRGFSKMLSNYLYNIADDSLKNMMINGACNEYTGKYTESINSLSIGIFKKFLQLRNATKGGKKSNKSRKRRHSHRKY